MPTSINDAEKRLRSYLLRLASDEELDSIEEAYLATSDHSDLISDAERRLVSDYVQGRLSTEEKQAFESNYLVTPDRREQVAIARSIGGLATAQKAAPHAPERREIPRHVHPTLWQRLLGWLAAPGPIVGMTAAATTAILLITNIALFLRWRDQAQQTEEASRTIQALRESKDKTATLPTISRMFGIPVLKIEEASLAPGQQQKLAFRLPPDVPDTIEIPLELPRTAEGATVDVSLSSLGETIWSARAVALRAAGEVLDADLRIPRASIQPHFGRPLRLDIVERGHATLAAYQITFEVRGDVR